MQTIAYGLAYACQLEYMCVYIYFPTMILILIIGEHDGDRSYGCTQ